MKRFGEADGRRKRVSPGRASVPLDSSKGHTPRRPLPPPSSGLERRRPPDGLAPAAARSETTGALAATRPLARRAPPEGAPRADLKQRPLRRPRATRPQYCRTRRSRPCLEMRSAKVALERCEASARRRVDQLVEQPRTHPLGRLESRTEACTALAISVRSDKGKMRRWLVEGGRAFGSTLRVVRVSDIAEARTAAGPEAEGSSTVASTLRMSSALLPILSGRDGVEGRSASSPTPKRGVRTGRTRRCRPAAPSAPCRGTLAAARLRPSACRSERDRGSCRSALHSKPARCFEQPGSSSGRAHGTHASFSRSEASHLASPSACRLRQRARSSARSDSSSFYCEARCVRSDRQRAGQLEIWRSVPLPAGPARAARPASQQGRVGTHRRSSSSLKSMGGSALSLKGAAGTGVAPGTTSRVEGETWAGVRGRRGSGEPAGQLARPGRRPPSSPPSLPLAASTAAPSPARSRHLAPRAVSSPILPCLMSVAGEAVQPKQPSLPRRRTSSTLRLTALPPPSAVFRVALPARANLWEAKP